MLAYPRARVLVVAGIHHLDSLLPWQAYDEAAPCITFRACKTEWNREADGENEGNTVTQEVPPARQ
jgi:hypothetical protein